MRLARGLIVSVLIVGACDSAGPRGQPGPGRRDTGTSSVADAAEAVADAGSWPDVKIIPDGGFVFDARAADAQGALDADPAPDAPGWPDAVVALDAVGQPDALAPDAAPPPGTGDVWFELDYTGASSPRSPRWSFSSTPGWGGAQWAAVNASYIEAWDRFNNMSVVNDPIGRSLEIGSSSQLQVMIGLEELLQYTTATVRIEGRSRATSSSLDFDVYNPWNGCGSSGRFGNQWQVQAVELDLAQCFELGQGVQAVRVEPRGTMALVRLRLTLSGARW